MPKTVKSFAPDSALLIRGIEHVCYEYANLMSAAHWSLTGAAPWRTHADDAFRIGCRKMHDFLLFPQRSKRGGDELPDILACDYLPTSTVVNWALPTWEKEWHDATHKQLAHFSYERNKSGDHRVWVPPLEKEFREAWGLFRSAVDPQYEQEFLRQIEHCRNEPGFATIDL